MVVNITQFLITRARINMYNSKSKKVVSPMLPQTTEHDNKVVDIIKKYFIETSIHGLKYIFEGKRVVLERLFWIIACLTLWTCAILLIYQVSSF